MAETAIDNSVETKQDFGQSPEAIVRRWKMELKLADKRERKWREKAKHIYKVYAPENPAANSFNVLWTNTETLRHAVYNSLPQPDVRRRYSDEDHLGKAVGTVLTRALEFAQDSYDFDGVIKGDVLSMLLAGRGLSRVRYVPSLRQIGVEGGPQDDDTQEGYTEEIEWEQVVCERVQWDDFRFSDGKVWDEITWVAFRHMLKREDLIEKFGEEIGNAIPLNDIDEESFNEAKDQEDAFKTAEIWEIWDRDEKKVLFICKSFPIPCMEEDDPLGLEGFYPIPRPLYAIENDQSLTPTPLYSQYEPQAKELNRISMRINKIIDVLRVRGVYDATIQEMSELMKAGDNELIASQGVIALLERGGLDKAIWMMPIDTCAIVLKELYAQREATKQVIYEVTGISDILRAASDPGETFGAQRLKSQWGSQRLQRLQLEVQRYIRDLVRLKAEIIAEKFQPETLKAMTLVDIPTQQEVQLKYQMAAMQAQAGGQPPPQPPQGVIVWEQVIETMRNDATRTYIVDIETDSTLSASQDNDMQSMQQLLQGLSQMMVGFAPVVQAGALPIEAVKQIMLAVCRRAKMGSAVEDAIDKMQPPQPQPDPNQAQMQIEQLKAQTTLQIEQGKAQIEAQKHDKQIQAEMQLEQFRQEMQARDNQHSQELEAQRDALQQQYAAQLKQMEIESKAAVEREKIASQERIALLNADKDERLASMNIEAGEKQKSEGESGDKGKGLEEMHGKTLDAMQQLITHIAKPKRIVRGADGLVIGVE